MKIGRIFSVLITTIKKYLMNITKQDVLAVAADLINKNGSTTTLEVKSVLRKNGFTARQTEVSNFMDELAKVDDEFAIVSDNGTYRTYGAVTSTTTSQPAASNNTTTSSTATQTTGMVIISTPVKGCWEVNAANHTGVTAVMYFAAGTTRDTVRQIFAKTNGVKFTDTRSRIYK